MAVSKFTPEARGALLERFAAGVSLRDACRAIGLRESTVKGWLSRGRREAEGRYADFAEAVEAARTDARARPEPMDEHELARVVSEMARGGSVQAAKLRWEMLRVEDAPEAPAGDLLDELEHRRRVRAQ